MTPTMFQKLLGASFYSLPPAVRTLHGNHGYCRYTGRARVVRGRNPLARLCASLSGLPSAREDVAVTVGFDTAPDAEHWRCDFGGQVMYPRLYRKDGQLNERHGMLRFRFALNAFGDALHWHVTAVRMLGVLPLPPSWFEGVYCREGEHDGRYTFRVEIAVPLLGELIHYEGWLEPVARSTASPDL